MKDWFASLLLMAELLMAQSVCAGSVNMELDNLVERANRKSDLSIEFIRVSDHQSIYKFNSGGKLIPASISKLTIAAAALDLFGPQHTFVTKAMITGSLNKGVVSGDLIIKGDGDPFLVNEKLFIFASDLKNRGIKEVRGSLIIDPFIFDMDTRDSSRDAGLSSSNNAYDAPVSGAGVNFNTFEMSLSAHDANANISLSPFPLGGYSVENKVRLGHETNVQVERVSLSNGKAKLVASGTLANQANLVKVYRSVNDPHLTAAEVIKAFLENQGIKIAGAIKIMPTPKQAREIGSIEGYPLDFIVKGLNNFSNNYIADMLLRRLGAAFPLQGEADLPGSGTEKSGLRVLENYLKTNIGIKSSFVLSNASGLSPENRFSAEQINHILYRMTQSLDIFPEFFYSLPAAGRDGTLKKRFHTDASKSVSSNIRAKTGTLTSPVSVSSLAGYIKTPRDGLLAFTVICNGRGGKPQPSTSELRDFQDSLVTYFASGNYPKTK
jgi:D-alanyl-D-alanine carboxypeptidase/D-alanyl-D-alanine-endopeptidase (penicillin-binding protein 4)